MFEKKYTREEIFEMLKDPEKFAMFLQQEQKQEKIENSYNNNYETYISHKSEYNRDTVLMDENGTLHRTANPFIGQNVPKITRDEYELLEFCHNTDMIPFLREEFTRNPIDREQAQKGYENAMREQCKEYIRNYNPNDYRNDEW